MAIANPLVITIGGSGGTAKSLPKVNQDAYGSEYLLRETTQEFRVRIRHSRESVAVGQYPIERHNVEFTQTVYGTAPAPDKIRQAYIVLRNTKTDLAADVSDLGEALSYYMDQTHFLDIIGWAN
jgi:hypothetical protein